MQDNMICNKEPIKIEEITRGNIIVSYKGNYYKILGEGLLLSAKNIYSYVIYRNSIDNTLSYIEQEEIRRQEFKEEVQGIKIQCMKDNEELVVYYSPEDISNGLKYIKDNNGEILYGKLIVRKDGKTFRLM